MDKFTTVKLFDLSAAPSDLREAEELIDLRPASNLNDQTIMSLRVGEYDATCDGLEDDNLTREITLTEYRLHTWLLESGAQQGELVMVYWKSDRPADYAGLAQAMANTA